VHVNWGWAGKDNGYYDLDNLNRYNSKQSMIIGIADSSYVPDIKVLKVNAPGTLKEIVTREDYMTLHHARIVGEINSDDVCVLWTLASSGSGVLNTIDLSDAIIQSLPDSAFTQCTNLVYVKLPKTLDRISRSAFARCRNMSYIELPNALKVIGANAFAACNRLVEIQFPQTLENIGSRAFNSCMLLEKVTLPSSVRHIGSYAFSHCYSLEELNIPATVEMVGKGITNNCKSLKNRQNY